MLLKFLVLFIALLQFIVYAAEKQHVNFNVHDDNLNLVAIEAIEKDLGAEKCQESSAKTKKLLEYLTSKGVSCDIIGEKLNCKSVWISRFLNDETPGLTLVGNVRSYYLIGGDRLSIILLIKAEEEKQKKAEETATWYFSDALSWLPFGSRSTSTSSTHSSDEGTLPNYSLSSTPPKSAEDPDRQLLLSKEEINTLDNLTEKDWAEIYKQKTIPDQTITKVRNRQPGYGMGSKSYNNVLKAAKKMS